ncbi:hypothetical protein [Geomicrobium sp. JCM 19039]|uniref:hypothetical protein n=1 Tax=Geomicrobium sp. JCM 19039 TaxID=1460636 RepID=UPI00045F3CAE|nr:hypothetical protein [Geomicrobium sp. JCM 19039]GAK14741.1 hypothetical protein JCM19039_4701 [Geomicrobium sp. JCM 19039]
MSHAFMSVIVYGMLVVSGMIFVDGPITLDTLLLPSVGIFLTVGLVEHFTMKKKRQPPQWLVIGSFAIGVVVAGSMISAHLIIG